MRTYNALGMQLRRLRHANTIKRREQNMSHQLLRWDVETRKSKDWISIVSAAKIMIRSSNIYLISCCLISIRERELSVAGKVESVLADETSTRFFPRANLFWSGGRQIIEIDLFVSRSINIFLISRSPICIQPSRKRLASRLSEKMVKSIR
jgi:hypothetical protein